MYINTENYLANVGSIQFGAAYSRTTLDKIAHWMHSHPTLLKVAEWAVIFFGAVLIATTPLTLPILGTIVVMTQIVAGLVLGVLGILALKYAEYLASPHDMKKRVFTPGTCPGGKLFYHKDEQTQHEIPILLLDADHPYHAGKAHGYLLAPNIDLLRQRFDFVLYTIARRTPAGGLTEILQKIRATIPQRYLDEIRGVADGFNEWIEEQWKNGCCSSVAKLSEDDLLLFHLQPDSLHFQPMLKGNENAFLRQAVSVGCTAITAQDAKKGFILGRNMDWPTFGAAGAHSLLVVRKHSNPAESSVEVSFPGFVGTLTGMKKSFRLCMNVCEGRSEEVQGMPAAFLNRYCLENSHSIEELESFLRRIPSLGPYHLTAADNKSAKAFHLKQGIHTQSTVRHLEKNGRPLVVTNCRYPSDRERTAHRHMSLEREAVLNEFFTDAQRKIPSDKLDMEALISYGLSLPFVNNFESAHTVVMSENSLAVAFDNNFSGSTPLSTLSFSMLSQL